MHIQRLWVLLAMSAVLRQVFPFFFKHIYSEDCGVVALHTFSNIFDGTESSETKGVWRQVESCIGRFDFFIFASCTTTSQKHVAWVLSLF